MAKALTLEDALNAGILRNSSCAIGVFDGVHLGHRMILESAIADSGDGAHVVLTFDKDPDEIFDSGGLHKLMSNEERIEALCNSGVDYVVVMPFNKEFAALSPQDFLETVFGDNVPKIIHVGSDFRFGHRASGTTDIMDEWAHAHGAKVVAHDLLCMSGEPVTSTRIRGLIEKGDTDAAETLLGRSCNL